MHLQIADDRILCEGIELLLLGGQDLQYSLHYIEKPGGELKHKEFLAISGEDPRRAIAESLCRDIPKIKHMPPEEQEVARKNLLAYCKLDTYAMVKVWEALLDAAK